MVYGDWRRDVPFVSRFSSAGVGKLVEAGDSSGAGIPDETGFSAEPQAHRYRK